MQSTDIAAEPKGPARAWWSELYQREAHPLETKTDAGVPDLDLSQIHSPVYDASVVSKFMSGHYADLASARKQSSALFKPLSEYYEKLIRELLLNDNIVRDCNAPLKILEIGAGFGGATVPALRIFPQAKLLASEFSLSMLSVLRDNVVAADLGDRCSFVQLNAEELDFKENSFDLVMGAAILHHLFKPEIALSQIQHILKPGGHALFFEPFEPGNGTMSVIFQLLLKDRRSAKLSESFRKYLEYSVLYWKGMALKAKSDAFFHSADDKWLFTQKFFSRMAQEIGFTSCSVEPINRVTRPIEFYVKNHFQGNGHPSVPNWVWEYTELFESSFSQDAKADLLVEGAVLFKK